MIAAFGLPVLFGFIAIAVDMMRIQSAKFELEQAADSISHAALVSLRDQDTKKEIRRKASKVAQRNDIDGNDVNIRAGKQIQFGFWDFEKSTWTKSNKTFNSVRVTLSRDDTNKDGPFEMMLTPFMGVNYVNLATETASIAAMRTRDTMVVVDTTGSFVVEMPDARKASLALLTTMRDRYIPGDRVGMATFVGAGQLFTELKDSLDDYSSIHAQWAGTGYKAPTGYSCTSNVGGNPQYWCQGKEWTMELQAVLVCWGWWCWYEYQWVEVLRPNIKFPMNRGLSWCSMRGNHSTIGGDVYLNSLGFYDHLIHWAPEMLNCGAGGGNTNQGAGLEVAMDELMKNGTVASVKSIVLISDGQPIDPYSLAWLAYFGGPNMGTRNAEQFGEYQADLADERDYSIFSVSFNDSPSGYWRDRQTEYLKSLTTGFGEFYETPNSSDLPAILKRIAENIPLVIVQ